ncbi:hypothetical protein [Croceicoccus naphthovorans]|uniref:Uncharacterized protein n=1 Tax=Croceicoccus naphthovorans TaxID=1348774 RepID=A0A0G3XET4_9SPHN|nr:hypothetical protein [Croceicoccus naphthovorans]AKM09712.1 hypothetical protein AB433_06530 [Croceicoccus naphthovorans]MBB3990852.1 hypothetical protein [Croceicoccus naphthovorans]
MDRDEFGAIGDAFRNIGGIMKERHRQEGAGATPPFPHFHDHLSREAKRMIANGQADLGNAVLAFRAAVEDADNE